MANIKEKENTIGRMDRLIMGSLYLVLDRDTENGDQLKKEEIATQVSTREIKKKDMEDISGQMVAVSKDLSNRTQSNF